MAVQLTLNQTVKLIREIAQSHNQINTIYFGDIWEFLAQPDNVYPAMFFSLTGSSIAGKNLAMDFSLFFLDRQLQDETNETDVLSDQLLIGQDIYSMMRYPKFDWKLEENVAIEFFTENEKDYLAGVKLDITINYPMLTDRCQVPSSFSYPDYITSIVESGGTVSYIKFLVDYPSYATLPSTGDPGKIYVTNDTNKLYRWKDAAWVQIYPSLNWGDIAGNIINQTDLQNALNAKYDASNPAGYINGITSSNVTTALGYTPENSSNKGVANGYASLDGSGTVPASQLPSYVDDVLEYANLASFPITGTTGKIYVDLATNKIYRWSGSIYIEVSPSVGTAWGGISGTLSNQTDLQTALNAKQATLTAGTGISITSNTISSTITQYADSNARSAISLTTTGTSGAATYNSTTGVLNVPNYASGGGSGTVTSVGLTAPTGFSVTGSPVTASGTLALAFATGYSLPSDATQATWTAKQSALNGTGFVKSTAGVISYDTNTYLTGITSGQVTTALGFTPYNSTNPSGYISANQSITLSGDISGTGTTAITTSLATITQAATGSFVKVTLDTKGRVTGNTAVGLSDITTALGFTPYNATNPSNYIALTGLSSTATGLTYTNTSGVFSLTSGYAIPTTASVANWDTAYTNRITSLTTTGSSGSATLVSNVLNVPTYTLSGLGGQASSTNLTSLSGLTFASTSFVKMTAAGTFALDTTAYTANTGTVTSVGGTGTVNGLTLTGTVTTSGSLTLGGTLDLSSPPAIGGTTASTGRFTTITSTIATGTAPFTVASTTNVANLNASSLNGATFAAPGTIGGTTAGAGNFTSVSVTTGYYDIQPAPTALTATATLTIAQIQGDIITVTSSTAVSLTLPTGTLTDAGVLGGALQTNGCFDWFIINLGSSTGAVTMVAGTAHTYVGNATVAINTSAQFRTRKTTTNTFVTYRIG